MTKPTLFSALLVLLLALGISSQAFTQTRVRGYYRSDGTYVQPHYRSAPNGTASDNYGAQGNQNPYTGQQGTRTQQQPSNTPSSTYTPPSGSYNGRTTYTGPRGGRYYINSSGNKTYVRP